MATRRKPQQVYLSYARSDAPRIERILAQLQSLGLVDPSDELVSDKALEPRHGALRDGVRRQIQSASKVVVVWTPASAASSWVNYEIGLADAFGKPIIPVVRRRDRPSLPPLLQDLQAVVVEDGD